MIYLTTFLFAVIALVVGSFLTALTYRWPRGKTVIKGRSFCPQCKKKIIWYDNIPLVSYLFLRGKCRSCRKNISPRYPLIEGATLVGFLIIWKNYLVCLDFFNYPILKGNLICRFHPSMDILTLPYFLFIFSLLLAIMVIDWESQIIPDKLVFTAYLTAILGLLIIDSDKFAAYVLAGLVAYLFFYVIHLATKGKGMGMGDAKLALFGGTLLGPIPTVDWIFLSFFVGALTGVGLVAFKKAKFGQRIAFGPIMILAFFVEVIVGMLVLPILDFV